MIRRLAWLLCAILPILSACGDGGTPTRENDFVPLTGIQISSGPASLATATTGDFTAVGFFSGIFQRDVTDEVQWTSSNPAVLAFSTLPGEEGTASALTPGTVTVTATSQGFTAQMSVTVVVKIPTSIDISPQPTGGQTQVEIPLGFTQQFTATGNFADGTTQDLTRDVLWAGNPVGKFTVGNGAANGGLVTPVEPGVATLTATFQGVTGSQEVLVKAAVLQSIAIDPLVTTNSLTAMPDGTTQFLKATGTFSDGDSRDITLDVLWTSSVPGTATVSNDAGSEGLVTAISAGTTAITATLNGVSGNSNVTVTNAALQSIEVTLDKSSISLAANETAQATAKGTFLEGVVSTVQDISLDVTWATLDTVIATVSNTAGSKGLVRGLEQGQAEVTATLGTVVSPTAVLDVVP